MIQFEVCTNTLSDALLASRYPIDRIEFCAALELGGLTPSLASFETFRKYSNVPACVMIRPRGGDFRYPEKEVEAMLKDAENFLKCGVDGIVFGFLNADRTVQIEATRRMVDLVHSYQSEAVFHKAFDETPDLFEAAKTLVWLGVDRILTQGGKKDIESGLQTIAALQQNYGEDVQILPGGGVNSDNLETILQISGCQQIHCSCKRVEGGIVSLDLQLLEEYLKLLNKKKIC